MRGLIIKSLKEFKGIQKTLRELKRIQENSNK